MHWYRALISLPLIVVLSGCGDTWGERTDGGMGAGTTPGKEFKF